MSVLLKTNNLSKSYGENLQKTYAIKSVNLEIDESDFTVIMGSSGSGKSTLLYLLSGLERPSDGKIWYKSEEVHDCGERKWSVLRRTMGFIYQAINLIPDLSLYENVLIAGYLTKEKKIVEQKATGIFEEIGLADIRKRLPSEVSGGEQQRCALARAIVNDPDILFADEPTGNLNSTSGNNVLQLIQRINEKGQTIVMVTHNIKAACFGKKIIYLKDGEIIDEYTFGKNENQQKREKNVFSWLSELGW